MTHIKKEDPTPVLRSSEKIMNLKLRFTQKFSGASDITIFVVVVHGNH